MPLGVAYRTESQYSYPASWGQGTVTHRTPTFASMIQPALDAGFQLEHVEEPPPTQELRDRNPEKAQWMDEHLGIIIFRFRRP